MRLSGLSIAIGDVRIGVFDKYPLTCFSHLKFNRKLRHALQVF